MSIKKEYDKQKSILIEKIIQLLQKFEEETDTYLIKTEIKPRYILKSLGAFGFPIKNRFFSFEIESTIENDEIKEVDGILYSKTDTNSKLPVFADIINLKENKK